ncbi:MAG: response regulator [Aureispira sp.]|nr:response regulator [Aureispira sp.]
MQKDYSLSFLILILLCNINVFRAQDYTTQTQFFSVKDGLSNQFTHAIYQDNKGFVWVGTQYGLNRWDGYDTKVYTREQHQLAGNKIVSIAEDANGVLWLQFGDTPIFGVFDPIEEKGMALDEYLKSPTPNFGGLVKAVHQTSNNHIYIADTLANLYLYNGKDLDHIIQKSNNYFISLYANPKAPSNVWGVNSSLEFSYSSEPQKMPEEYNLKLNNSFSYFRPIHVDKSNTFYFSFFNSLDKSDPLHDNLSVLVAKKSPNKPAEVLKLEHERDLINGDYFNLGMPLLSWSDSNWVAFTSSQYKNIDLYNQQGKLLYRSPPIFEDPNIISNAIVAKDQSIWVTTSNGIQLVKIQKSPFQKLMHSQTGEPRILSSRGLVAVGDTLYGGGYDYNGLFKLNLKTGEISYTKAIQDIVNDRYQSDAMLVLSMLKDKKGNIWAGDNFYLIIKYNPKTGKATPFAYKGYEHEIKKDKLPKPSAFWALFEDQDEKIWAGTASGLCYLDQEHNYIVPFEQYNEFEQLRGSLILCFHENDKGIWIGSNSGLYLLNKNKGVVQRYATDLEGKNFFPHNHISKIHEDKEGIFWLSTKGGGLIKWSPNTSEHKQYMTAQGLSHNVLYSVYEDSFNNLWMSSDFGIMQFDKSKAKEGSEDLVSVYLPRDGITQQEFNTAAHYQAATGQIYFGGLNGITSFHPKYFKTKAQNNTPIQVTYYARLDSRKGDYVEETKAFLKNPVIELEENKRTFQIKFALMDFLDAKQNKYSYKIEGLNKKWLHLSENSLQIGGMPYGAYTLVIQAQGSNGAWSNHPLKIPIIVFRPFYLTWWFILLCILGVITAISGFIYWRLQRLRLAKEELEKEVQLRTTQIAEDKKLIEAQAQKLLSLDKVKNRFFANISHELRTPLTLILAPIRFLTTKKTFSLTEAKALLSVMERNGNRLLSLVEEILDLSKLESGKLELHLTKVAFAPFIRRLYSNFESQAQYQKIYYQLSYRANEALEIDLDINKFEKILNNLLSNAIKFTPEQGTILLDIEELDQELILTVRDTGKGIHPSDLPYVFDRFYQSRQPDAPTQGGTGIGLALSKELVELFGGELKVESQLKEGTTFSFVLPKKEATTLPSFVEETSIELQKEELILEDLIPIPPNTKKNNILIVEDNVDMRLFIKTILQPYFNIETAENGKVALEYLQKVGVDKLDLVLTDYMMPEMDGMQLLEHIKTKKPFKVLPTMLLTARAAEQDKLKGFRIGVDDYITKPFSPEELIVRIQNLIENATNRKQWLQEEVEKISIEQTSTENKSKKTEQKASKKIVITEEDMLWLQEVETIVIKKCTNNNFSVDWLADEINLSPRQLQRRLQKLTGLTSKKYINEVRLQEARAMLENKKYNTIAQVMHAVGFQKSGHFAKIYATRFGKTPSDYLK